jgi:mannose-6-phosphate isomerase-like protein (cupin superfamily)
VTELVKDFIQHVEKVWGDEYWIANNELYCAKFLYINPGGCCSLHYHKVKDETFFVDTGECFLELGEETLRLEEGSSVRITPGTKHRFWVPPGPYAHICRIIEVSTHHSDDDVVRLEESKHLTK